MLMFLEYLDSVIYEIVNRLDRDSSKLGMQNITKTKLMTHMKLRLFNLKFIFCYLFLIMIHSRRFE